MNSNALPADVEYLKKHVYQKKKKKKAGCWIMVFAD